MHLLTRGNGYEVLDQDPKKGRLRLKSDNGRARWFPSECFDLRGRAVSTLTLWKFDDDVTDPFGWIEVSLTFSNGSRRWSILFTPDRLKTLLEHPEGDAGIQSAHMIIVKDLEWATVEAALRTFDEQGELEGASLPLVDDRG